MNFDVIIIGGGAAGLSAGLWCDDLGLNALLLESGERIRRTASLDAQCYRKSSRNQSKKRTRTV